MKLKGKKTKRKEKKKHQTLLQWIVFVDVTIKI